MGILCTRGHIGVAVDDDARSPLHCPLAHPSRAVRNPSCPARGTPRPAAIAVVAAPPARETKTREVGPLGPRTAMDMNRYSVIPDKRPREIVLLQGRGCFWRRCAFCDYYHDAQPDDDAAFALNSRVLSQVTGQLQSSLNQVLSKIPIGSISACLAELARITALAANIDKLIDKFAEAVGTVLTLGLNKFLEALDKLGISL